MTSDYVQAREELLERCGYPLTPIPMDTPLSSGAESIGLIGEQLRVALACIDALERRVRELETFRQV